MDKMNQIHNDESKFQCLSPTELNDNMVKIEAKLQKRLLEQVKSYQLPEDVYEAIHPTGLQRPQMYGLPKIQKVDVLLRPILYMVGSAHHELAKWLAGLLQPVLECFSVNCIKDFLMFAEMIQQIEFDSDNVNLCSFDVTSLFTNVLLTGSIKMWSYTLYKDATMTTPILQEVFVELMEYATSSVEFNFNNNCITRLMK